MSTPESIERRLADAARRYLGCYVSADDPALAERLVRWRTDMLALAEAEVSVSPQDKGVAGLPDLHQLQDSEVQQLVGSAIGLVEEFLDGVYGQMNAELPRSPTVLFAVWEPDRHPRWPKGTPGQTRHGHPLAGKFMETPDLLDRLAATVSGAVDVTFLARGATEIQRISADRDGATGLNLTTQMRDGSQHTINVPSDQIPSHQVIDAISKVENDARGEHPPVAPGDHPAGVPTPAGVTTPTPPGVPPAPAAPIAPPEAHAPGQAPPEPHAPAGAPEPRRRPKPRKPPEPAAPEPPHAPAFESTAWARKPVPERVSQFQALAPSEREALAEPTHTIPARIEELVGPQAADVNAEIEQVRAKGLMAPDVFTRLKRSAVELRRHLGAAGASNKDRDRLVQSYIRYMAAQEAESQTRTLGDHGLRHLLGDAEMAKQVIEEVPGHDSDADFALILLAGAFHDAGYLTPPSRIFLDKDHPEWSTTNYDGNLRDQVVAALGTQNAETLRHMVETHAGTEVDWEDDALGSAFRLADNLALFHDEKMPPVVYHVPQNAEVLARYGSGEIDLAQAKAEMEQNITAAGLPAGVKERIRASLDELSPFLPKNALGMLGGRIDGFKWKAGHLQVRLHRDDRNDNLARVLDVGQRQFSKLAEAYLGEDGAARFRTDNRLDLNHPTRGKVVEFAITGDPVREPHDDPPVPDTTDLPSRDIVDAALGLTDLPPPEPDGFGSVEVAPGVRIGQRATWPNRVSFERGYPGWRIELPGRWRDMTPAERRREMDNAIATRFAGQFATFAGGNRTPDPALAALTSLAFKDADGNPLSEPVERLGSGAYDHVVAAYEALRGDDWQDALNRFPGVGIVGRVATRKGWPLHPDAQRTIRAGDLGSPYRAGHIPVNPDHVAAVDARLAQLRPQFANDHGLTEHDYLARLAQQTSDLVDGRRLAVRVRGRSLPAILRDGRMRTVGDVRTTGAGGVRDRRVRLDEYIDSRRRFEQQVFGIPREDEEPLRRPIYGYLTAGDPIEERGMDHYGDTVILLKPSVRDRATFTMGDSLDGLSGRLYAGVPMPINSDPVERTRGWMVQHDQNDPLANAATTRAVGYVEAQIHSDGSAPQVALSDIAEIHFTAGSRPSAGTRRQLEAAGIPWRTVEFGSPDVPSDQPAPVVEFHRRADVYGRAHGGTADTYFRPQAPVDWAGPRWNEVWYEATASPDAAGFFDLPADAQRALSPDGPPAHATYDQALWSFRKAHLMESGRYRRPPTETPWDRLSEADQAAVRAAVYRAQGRGEALDLIPEPQQGMIRRLASDSGVDLTAGPSRTAAWEQAPSPDEGRRRLAGLASNFGVVVAATAPSDAGEIAPGVRYSPTLSGEARNVGDHIEVGPRFFDLSAEQRRGVLAHEAGHYVDEQVLRDPNSWVWDGEQWNDANGVPLGGPTARPGERIADAVGAILTGDTESMARWPAIGRLQRELGLEPPAPQFENGQYVTWGEGALQRGQVEGHTSDGGVRVLTPAGTHRIIHPSELRPLGRPTPAEPQFREGDRVRISDTAPHDAGAVGRVTGTSTDFTRYRVEIEGGGIASFEAGHLAAAEPKPTPPTPAARARLDALSVGDTFTTEGVTYRVRSTGRSDRRITVTPTAGGAARHLAPGRMVDRSAPPAGDTVFLVGDRLRIASGAHAGQVGEVVEARPNENLYRVSIPDGHGVPRALWYLRDEVSREGDPVPDVPPTPDPTGLTPTQAQHVEDTFRDLASGRIDAERAHDQLVSDMGLTDAQARTQFQRRNVPFPTPPEPRPPQASVLFIDGQIWTIRQGQRADGRIGLIGPNGERRYLSAASVERMRGGGTPPAARFPINTTVYARELRVGDLVTGQSGQVSEVVGLTQTGGNGRIRLRNRASGATTAWEDTIPLRYLGPRGADVPATGHVPPIAAELAGRTLPPLRRVPPTPPPPIPARAGGVERNADNAVEARFDVAAFERDAARLGIPMTPSHVVGMFDSPTMKAKGLTVQIRSARAHSDGERQVSISASFLDAAGRQIGETTRYLNFDKKTVKHSYLSINREHRDGGITKDLFASMISTYKDLGMEKVKVGANIDVGGYAWGRYGFIGGPGDLAHLQQRVRNAMNDRVSTWLAQGRIDQAQADAFRAKIRDAVEGTADTIDLACLRIAVTVDGKATKLSSKPALLGSSWSGTLTLNPRSKSWKRLVKYLGEKGYTEAQISARRRITGGE